MSNGTPLVCAYADRGFEFRERLPFGAGPGTTIEDSYFGVRCPNCRREFNATPGHGTYEVQQDGRLKLARVAARAAAAALRAADADEIASLRDTVLDARDRKQDVAAAIRARGPVFPRWEAFAQENPQLAAFLQNTAVGLLVGLLLLLAQQAIEGRASDGSPQPAVSEEDIRRLVSELAEHGVLRDGAPGEAPDGVVGEGGGADPCDADGERDRSGPTLSEQSDEHRQGDE